MNERGGIRWKLALSLFLAASAVVVLTYRWRAAPSMDDLVKGKEIDPDRLLSSQMLSMQTSPDNVDEVVRRFAERAREEIADSAPRRFDASQRADLVAAFESRARMLFNPDADRDLAAMQERGYSDSKETAFRTRAWLRSWGEGKGGDSTKFCRTNPNELHVSWAEDGFLSQLAGEKGFDVVYGFRQNGPNGGPIPEIPTDAASKASVVEIVVPVEVSPVELKDGVFKVLANRQPAFAGYRFIWSGKRNQWIVQDSVLITKPGHQFGSLIAYF